MAPQIARHARSSSVPSLPHPLAIKALEKLHNLNTAIHGHAEPSFDSLSILLGDLADLFESLHALLRLPSLLSQPIHKQWLESQLDYSLHLLDIEAPLNDGVASAKSFVFDLQSALRRKGGNGLISCRKKAQKESVKCMKSLKRMEEGFSIAVVAVREGDLAVIDRLMRETRRTTATVLRSLVALIEIPSAVKRKEWGKRISLVPRVVKWRNGGCAEGETSHVGLESSLRASFECIFGRDDEGFESLKRKKSLEEVNLVESGIEKMEIGLECLFKQIIHNRVALLNLLSS